MLRLQTNSCDFAGMRDTLQLAIAQVASRHAQLANCPTCGGQSARMARGVLNLKKLLDLLEEVPHGTPDLAD